MAHLKCMVGWTVRNKWRNNWIFKLLFFIW